jgi:hypothetical protein
MIGAIKLPAERSRRSIRHRSVEKGRFGAVCEFVGLLAPHVRRAVTIGGLLEQRTLKRDAIAADGSVIRRRYSGR